VPSYGQGRATFRVNTPIQGTAADVFKAGLVRLVETRSQHPNVDLVLVVHDEVVLECAIEDADQVRTWVTECLTAGVQRYLPSVPIQVDIHVSNSWGGDDVVHARDNQPESVSTIGSEGVDRTTPSLEKV
jgi:DNA polymerase I-like protein with 3'-5' exonuclease and polymerase domains